MYYTNKAVHVKFDYLFYLMTFHEGQVSGAPTVYCFHLLDFYCSSLVLLPQMTGFYYSTLALLPQLQGFYCSSPFVLPLDLRSDQQNAFVTPFDLLLREHHQWC